MITTEQRQAIAEDYRNGMKVVEILKKYDCSSHDVTKAVDENGVPRRKKPGERRNRKSAIKKCPTCKKTVDIKGARFCPYCGGDIRSEVEILDERLNNLWSMLVVLPTAMASEAQETINAVSAYLKKEV